MRFAPVLFAILVLLTTPTRSLAWRVCDVRHPDFGARGDGRAKDTMAIRSAIAACDEVWLPPGGTFLTGPVNLTSNQVLRVDGTMLASADVSDFPLIAPLMGYGWGDDENCFGPGAAPHKIVVGSLRYSPIIGAYHVRNVTITGAGVIDGAGQTWWDNCTRCHYTPGNNSHYCEIASRPKLIETQFVTGLRVVGAAAKSAAPALARPPAKMDSPGMQACRVTTGVYTLQPSHADATHGSYDAYTPTTRMAAARRLREVAVSFDKHRGSFCGDSKGHHAAIVSGGDGMSLAECSAKCADVGCSCFDIRPSPSPSPPTPTPPFVPPTPAPPVCPGTLTLQNSPFWTLTPSYTQNIHVRDLRILAPMDRIGNTDGVNLDSCRDALVENVYIRNSDDGVCIKSGLNGFGLNLAIPTEDVLVRNITCATGGRGGFALGSEMSGGMRNITFMASALDGERGIDIKPSVGRGGYMDRVTFINITGRGVGFSMGHDGATLMPDNHYVPLVSNLAFLGVPSAVGNSFKACAQANRSKCFNLSVDGKATEWPDPLPPQSFSCKRRAQTMFGTVDLPWGVCVPLDAPVNIRPDYPNWGPLEGKYASLAACRAECS